MPRGRSGVSGVSLADWAGRALDAGETKVTSARFRVPRVIDEDIQRGPADDSQGQAGMTDPLESAEMANCPETKQPRSYVTEAE